MALSILRHPWVAALAGRRGFASSVNYLKAGTPPSRADADDGASTPTWASDLATPPPTAFELRRRAAAAGDAFPTGEATKLFKLEARAVIKANNTLKAKK